MNNNTKRSQARGKVDRNNSFYPRVRSSSGGFMSDKSFKRVFNHCIQTGTPSAAVMETSDARDNELEQMIRARGGDIQSPGYC